MLWFCSTTAGKCPCRSKTLADRRMDLRIPWKVLSKEGASSSTQSAFSLKRIAFLVIVGLALVAGIVLRSSHYFTQSEVGQNAPVEVTPPPPPATATTESVSQSPTPVQEAAPSPNEQKEPTGEAIKKPEQADEAVEHPEQPE